MVRVQELTASQGHVSYTVLGDDYLPIGPVETYLAFLSDLNYSPNTVKALPDTLLIAW